MDKQISFENLVASIKDISTKAGNFAKSAVNQLMTMRNWVIGYYIVEFEQNGKDRAKYGERLLSRIAKNINIKGLDRPTLNLCRLFYLRYPQICDSVSHKLKNICKIDGLLDFKPCLGNPQICATLSHKFETSPELLLNKLSFSHIREIMPIEDPFERYFYETECIKGTW